MAGNVAKRLIVPPGVRNAARRSIQSPLLKDRMVYNKYSYETGGEYTELDAMIAPGYDNPEHFHTLFSETFTCLTGELAMMLDGESILLKPGESAKVEIGHYHSLAYRSNKEATFRTRLEPGYEGFEKAMYIMHGLAEDGLTDKDGIPSNPVHLAVMADMMDTQLTGWTSWLANPLLFTLRRYGKGNGVESHLLEKYWNSA